MDDARHIEAIKARRISCKLRRTQCGCWLAGWLAAAHPASPTWQHLASAPCVRWQMAQGAPRRSGRRFSTPVTTAQEAAPVTHVSGCHSASTCEMAWAGRGAW